MSVHSKTEKAMCPAKLTGLQRFTNSMQMLGIRRQEKRKEEKDDILENKKHIPTHFLS